LLKAALLHPKNNAITTQGRNSP
jgi:hypothetical protein